MTYCLGIKINQSTIMISDSRTSAGVDNISVYSKMWRFGVPGQRQFVLCSAGSLATSQAVLANIERDIKLNAEINLANVVDLHAACSYIGRLSVACQKQNTGGGPAYESTFLFAGEILGAPNRLFLIYPQGNYIESSDQVPFLQMGETKYGKPILDRVVQGKMTTDRAILCGLVSMDATIRSNLTVGPPIELYVLDSGSLQAGKYMKFNEHDEYMSSLRKVWNRLMGEAVDQLQPIIW